MRLLILSDLHLEFAPFQPPAVEADAVILAGDVHVGRHGLQWIREAFPSQPVIYVLGNHEFYGEFLPKLTDDLQTAAAHSNVHLLENARVDLDGVTFLGATLWSDFALLGDPVLASLTAELGISDFYRIRTLPGRRRLTAEYLRKIHAASVNWLGGECERVRGRPLVVVTHHAPSRRSVPPKFSDDALNPAFASHLDRLVEASGAALWIHGHIHYCADYRIGATRVVANPRGYPGEHVGSFDPGLIVTV